MSSLYQLITNAQHRSNLALCQSIHAGPGSCVPHQVTRPVAGAATLWCNVACAESGSEMFPPAWPSKPLSGPFVLVDSRVPVPSYQQLLLRQCKAINPRPNSSKLYHPNWESEDRFLCPVLKSAPRCHQRV